MKQEPAKIGDYSFDEIYSKHYKKILYYIRWKFKFSMEAAEEIVQDAFMKAYEKREQFDARAHPSRWIGGIARYTGLDYIRKLKRRGYTTTYDERFHGIDELVATHNRPEPNDGLPTMTEMVEHIKAPRTKKVFELHYIQDKSQREIAKELHTNKTCIYTHLCQARKLLIEKFNSGKLEK